MWFEKGKGHWGFIVINFNWLKSTSELTNADVFARNILQPYILGVSVVSTVADSLTCLCPISSSFQHKACAAGVHHILWFKCFCIHWCHHGWCILQLTDRCSPPHGAFGMGQAHLHLHLHPLALSIDSCQPVNQTLSRSRENCIIPNVELILKQIKKSIYY